MIGYIKGILVEAGEQEILLENQGIGYRIFVPGSTLGGGLSVGETIKVYTYLHVKEDAIQLYGFSTKDDLSVFKLLLGVNGIGPKAGLGILSVLTAEELRFAVLSDDVKTLSKAPGIGKKTAQKLILELKDKFNLEDVLNHPAEAEVSGGSLAGNEESMREAVLALTALGYPNTQALQAVRKVQGAAGMDVEEILKAALKYMI